MLDFAPCRGTLKPHQRRASVQRKEMLYAHASSHALGVQLVVFLQHMASALLQAPPHVHSSKEGSRKRSHPAPGCSFDSLSDMERALVQGSGHHVEY